MKPTGASRIVKNTEKASFTSLFLKKQLAVCVHTVRFTFSKMPCK